MQNRRASMRWSDFGGHVDRGESLLQAAAREAYEESMGLLGTAQQVEEELRAQRAPQIRTKNARGAHFLLRVRFDHTLPRAFNAFRHYAQTSALAAGTNALPAQENGFWEKVRCAWVPLNSVEREVTLRHEFFQDLPVLRRELHARVQQ